MNSNSYEQGQMSYGGELCPVVGERSAQEGTEVSPVTEEEVRGEEEEETRAVSAPPVPMTPSREEVENTA